jgi:hypothetical protein
MPGELYHLSSAKVASEEFNLPLSIGIGGRLRPEYPRQNKEEHGE